MTSWFRSWHGAPTDTKWLTIARRAGVAPGVVSAVAWALLDYASQHQDRGSVGGFDAETYAVFSGFDESDVLAVIQALVAKEMIVDNRWASWEKRQPEREDNSAERVRRHREARAVQPDETLSKRYTGVTETPTDNVTHRNAVKRSETQGNAPDTDTDTDTKKIQSTDTDQRSDTRLSPLSASLPADDILFDALAEVAPKTVPFKRQFSSAKQRDQWHEVSDALGLEEVQRCVDWCVVNERTAIGKIISSAQTWHNNNRKATAQSVNGRPARAEQEPAYKRAIRSFIQKEGLIPDGI